jgi:tetratricopeptide (TPR) repeat protein
MTNHVSSGRVRVPAALGPDPAELADRGLSKLRAGDPNGAVADLSEAIRLAPGRPDYYHRRAGAHLARRDFRAALADADAAVRMSPRRVYYLVTRANAHYHLKDAAAALADYRFAFACDPAETARVVVDNAEAEARERPGFSYLDTENHLLADPDDIASLIRRGLVAILLGRDGPRVDEDFAAVVRLRPASKGAVAAYAEEARRRVASRTPDGGVASASEVRLSEVGLEPT